jgi:citrate synthase
MPESSFKAGLEDVVAGTSDICFIDGHEGRLLYRGYNITDLAAHSTFEEVAFLLWEGHLPTASELAAFTSAMAGDRAVSAPVMALVKSLPHTTHPMDMLRTAVSLMGIYDPNAGVMTPDANKAKARRLTAQLPTLVAAFDRVRNGREPVAPDPSLSLAENFLYMLHGKRPPALHAKVMDVALMLHADHELNASTFSARVTAGTLSDMYSAITSAIGTLKGPLHGGANEQVMLMLEEIGSVERVESWMAEALAAKRKIMGFGHRVYKTEDPRATILRRYSEEVGRAAGQLKWYEMLRKVEAEFPQGKPLYPNVDFYSGSVYTLMGIPRDVFTPVFAMSRMAGWTTHVLEQYGNNRLIRPRAEYTGPTRLEYVAIENRG